MQHCDKIGCLLCSTSVKTSKLMFLEVSLLFSKTSKELLFCTIRAYTRNTIETIISSLF